MTVPHQLPPPDRTAGCATLPPTVKPRLIDTRDNDFHVLPTRGLVPNRRTQDTEALRIPRHSRYRQLELSPGVSVKRGFTVSASMCTQGKTDLVGCNAKHTRFYCIGIHVHQPTPTQPQPNPTQHQPSPTQAQPSEILTHPTSYYILYILL
jgi:hypothetical protein